MTTLTGTEKQIKWAEEIRKAALEAIEALPEHKKTYLETIGAPVSEVVNRLNSASNAKWWIGGYQGNLARRILNEQNEPAMSREATVMEFVKGMQRRMKRGR